MRLFLKAIHGPHQGLATRLDPPQQVTVGRYKKQVDIVLSGDGTLSRQHFMLFYDRDQAGWWLKDLQSRNGTLLNGQKVELVQLRDGDRIRAGASVFSVELSPQENADDDRAPGLESAHQPQAPSTPTKTPPATEAMAILNDVDLHPPPATFGPGQWLTALRALGLAAEPLGGRELELDDGGVAVRLSLSGDGRPRTLSAADGRRWRLDYDGERLRQVSYPNGLTVQFDYHPHGLPGVIRHDEQVELELDYDANQRLTALRYGGDEEVLYDYDKYGRLSARSWGGLRERYRYNEDGDLTQIIDPAGQIYRYRYRDWDRPVQITEPDGRNSHFGYDQHGRLRQLTGRDAEIDYLDDSDLPTAVRYPDETLEFGYDAERRVQLARSEGASGSVQVSYLYNRGRLSGETISDHQTVGYRYGKSDGGRCSGLIYPDNRALGYEFDSAGRLLRLRDWQGAQFDWAYSADNLASLSFANGLQCLTRYHSNGLVLEQRLSNAGDSNTPLAVSRYRYDRRGRLLERDDQRLGRRSCRYDDCGRLAEVSGDAEERFGYDAADNRTRCGDQTATVDSNRLLEQGGWRCQYDDAGQLVALSIGGDQGWWRFGYSRRGLLARAENDRGLNLVFGYDPYGRRLSKQVSGAGRDYRLDYFWAGELLIGERVSGAREQQRDYLYPPGSQVPVAARVDERLYCCHANALGGIERLTDETGKPAWETDYSAFGKPRGRGEPDISPLLPGCHFDPETGLYYQRWRYYSPQLGRYLSPDPFAPLNGLNSYIFLHNDPLNPLRWQRPWRWPAAAERAATVAVEAGSLRAAPTPPGLLRLPGNAGSALEVLPGSTLAALLSGELELPLLARQPAALRRPLGELTVDPKLVWLVFEER